MKSGIVFICLTVASVGCGASTNVPKKQKLPPVLALEVPQSLVTIGCGKTIVCPKIPNTYAWFEPERQKKVRRFWLDVHETLSQDFVDCGTAGGCEKSQLEPGAARITYDNAVAFCQWRGGRLPTSIEWEAAARSNDGRIYPWGNMPAPTIAQVGLSYYSGSGHLGMAFRSSPTLPPGPYGHFDLAGGAAEFVQDPSPDFHLVKGASGSDGEGEAYAATVTQSTYGELYASKPESFAGFRCAYDQDPADPEEKIQTAKIPSSRTPTKDPERGSPKIPNAGRSRTGFVDRPPRERWQSGGARREKHAELADFGVKPGKFSGAGTAADAGNWPKSRGRKC